MLGTPVLRVPARRTLVLGTLLLSILKNAHLNKMIFVIFLPALHNWNLSPYLRPVRFANEFAVRR